MAKKRKLDPAPADRGELHTLLDAAKADPFDVNARLVLADWLEEHGGEADRARAEVIRLQIESANGGIPWAKRVEKIREKWVRDWMGEAHKAFCRSAYPKVEDGLLSTTVAANKWPADGVVDGAWWWVETARPVTAKPRQLKTMAQSPLLSTVTRLDLSGRRWSHLALSPLMPKLDHLRALYYGVHDDRAMGMLARSKAELSRLWLDTFVVSATAWATFLASDLAARLRELRLPGDLPEYPGAFERLTNLRRLSLSSLGVDPARLPPLRALRVNDCDQGFDVFARLACSPCGPTLEELELHDLRPSGDFPAFRFPRLRRLQACDAFNALAAARFADAGGFEGLSWLDLSDNAIGTAGLGVALARISVGPSRLHLDDCGLGDAGIRQLASWPGLAGVRVLSLIDNNISPDGLRALADSPHATSLEALRLDRNAGLTAVAVDHLLSSQAGAKLRLLSAANGIPGRAFVLGDEAKRLEELTL